MSKIPIILVAILATMITSAAQAAVLPDKTCGLEPSACGESSQTPKYFSSIERVTYQGPDSKEPLAYKHYDANAIILGKPMKEWLRFSMAFWHTMRGDGSDPFGSPTKSWPWYANL